MPDVKVYTTWWCGHCHRLKFQLRRAHIPFEDINVEDHPEISARIIEQTGGMRVVPTVTIGELLLVNPTIDEIRAGLEPAGASFSG